MGKGDKRSKRGKIFKGTTGNSRPRKKTTAKVEVKPAVKKTKKKADAK